MNWEAMGVIAEVAGAVAVIVSLVYLAIQVSSNTRALRATASFDTTHSWATTNEMLVGAIVGESDFQAGRESRFVEAAAKFYDPDTQPGDMSNTEIVSMSLLHRSLFQRLEGQYFQYKHGYVEHQIWIARRDWARSLVALPMVRVWWDEEMLSSIYSSEFVSVISEAPTAEVSAKLPGYSETQ